jgi:hypothetical protein
MLALLAGIVFTCLEISVKYSSVVMADGLLTFVLVLATLAFLRFIEGRQRIAYAMAFGLLASVAFLIKGYAICLVLVPVFVVILLRRWDVLRWPSLWIAPAIVVVLVGPWYWISRGMQSGTWTNVTVSHYVRIAVPFYWLVVKVELGAIGRLVAVLGMVRVLLTLRDRHKTDIIGVGLFSLMLSAWIVNCTIPAGREIRFWLPSVPSFVYFLVQGADWIAKWLTRWNPKVTRWQTAVVAVLVLLILIMAWRPYHKEFYGMGRVAEAVLHGPAVEFPSVLIVSDVPGEGAFIAEMADRRKDVNSVVIRGSKLLADSNWVGSDYRLLYESPEAVVRVLDSIPVYYVAIDDATGAKVAAHQQLAQQTIAQYPERFQLLGTFPLVRPEEEEAGNVRLYRFIHNQAPPDWLGVSLSRFAGAETKILVPRMKPAESRK